MHTECDRDCEQILGIRFFTGGVGDAVDRMLQGGLLVVPAAPGLIHLKTQPAYRQALLSADMVLPDSSYMMMVWNGAVRWLVGRPPIHRMSGLAYLRELLQRKEIRTAGSTLWVMVGAKSTRMNIAWLTEQGIMVPSTYVYEAPMYGEIDGSPIADPELLAMVDRLRPNHVIITIGGGTQERLGLYLRQHLTYLPGIHCIGAAIAFLSGDQTKIPCWADKYYLGWWLRVKGDKKTYAGRYLRALRLGWMMLCYRTDLPPLARTRTQESDAASLCLR